MDYQTIIDTALLYADTTDIEVVARMPSFLLIVESRINRILNIRRQSKRAYLYTVSGQYEYGLPIDFAGMRDVRIKDDLDSKSSFSLHFVAPEYMNAYRNTEGTEGLYSIITNSLFIWPIQDNKVIEMTYYQRIVPLTITDFTNWMSDYYPDGYIQGLLVEICAFRKDTDAAAMWDSRFQATLQEIIIEDSVDRWSGPALVTRMM